MNPFQILERIGSESSLSGMENRLAEAEESVEEAPLAQRPRELPGLLVKPQFSSEEHEALEKDGFTVVKSKRKKPAKCDIVFTDEGKKAEDDPQPVAQDTFMKNRGVVYAVSAAAVATIGFVIFKVLRR